jgi:hypothetical protein
MKRILALPTLALVTLVLALPAAAGKPAKTVVDLGTPAREAEFAAVLTRGMRRADPGRCDRQSDHHRPRQATSARRRRDQRVQLPRARHEPRDRRDDDDRRCWTRSLQDRSGDWSSAASDHRPLDHRLRRHRSIRDRPRHRRGRSCLWARGRVPRRDLRGPRLERHRRAGERVNRAHLSSSASPILDRRATCLPRRGRPTASVKTKGPTCFEVDPFVSLRAHEFLFCTCTLPRGEATTARHRFPCRD